MPTIRTTFEPWKTVEVDQFELGNLQAQGVVAEVIRDAPVAATAVPASPFVASAAKEN